MARAGRPPTPEDEQLVNVIGLMNKHVEMLDRVIRERSERDLKCVVVTEPERRVIDEVGYLGYDARAADLIFQLVSRRYEHRSLLITTNLPFKRIKNRGVGVNEQVRANQIGSPPVWSPGDRIPTAAGAAAVRPFNHTPKRARRGSCGGFSNAET